MCERGAEVALSKGRLSPIPANLKRPSTSQPSVQAESQFRRFRDPCLAYRLAASSGQLPPAIPRLAQRREAGRQTEQAVEGLEVAVFEGQRSAKRPIGRVAARRDSGKAVQAAAKQNKDQTPGLLHLRERHARAAERGSPPRHMVSRKARRFMLSPLKRRAAVSPKLKAWAYGGTSPDEGRQTGRAAGPSFSSGITRTAAASKRTRTLSSPGDSPRR